MFERKDWLKKPWLFKVSILFYKENKYKNLACAETEVKRVPILFNHGDDYTK